MWATLACGPANGVSQTDMSFRALPFEIKKKISGPIGLGATKPASSGCAFHNSTRGISPHLDTNGVDIFWASSEWVTTPIAIIA
tara:strand:+ start:260 stop:511 length:252 start_codon:yes stop_codon:yes gene_type:complete